MTIRFAPLGLGSVSTIGVVKGRGVNHCLMSSGSVHARNTLSNDASIILKELNRGWMHG
ncbi:hypothetical protein NARC_50161 [Candidatus Nitrosocosmicus arcticus]|uniref:Uncharacterized protein n=1 Tax=Candidatus Nitrosocosmicus arcticus TaxID=2035267 RepID=A0A557SWK4_9ARCH|nr:hypothetical protein [Candidatus Nitrosocosmicus arcticus]TVP40980.1 hypothetical protein NARC_50161 [Candidatus Nitrosocosmicus arcticus]